MHCAPLPQPYGSVDGQLDGVFELTSEGYQVVGATDTMEVLGTTPAIPPGTFVHIAYTCNSGFYGPGGDFVLLQNLPTFEGKAHTTEAGERLWFAAASGGEVYVPDGLLPFEISKSTACQIGDFPEAFTLVADLEVKGPGPSVVIAPGKQGTFSATSGPHAGSYRVKNEEVTFVGYEGGDATDTVNFSIARAE